MSIRTYNIQLSGEQLFVNHWFNLLSTTRDAYNRCSQLIVENNIPMSLKVVHNKCYNTLRSEYPSLPSQSVIRIQREVLSAFKSKKSNKHNGSAPQKYNLSMTLDKRMYSNFTRDGISLVSEVSNKRKRLSFTPYPKIAEMFATSVAKDPTMFCRDGKLWLSIPFEFNGCMPESVCAVGVDLGMKRFFVTSEGKAFTDKEYLGRRRKIRYLKKKLQSKATKSAKKHLRKVSRKEHNMSKNYCHQACNALIKSTKASFVVMEDLTKIKKNTSRSKDGYKRKRHNNAISQVPFYMLKQIMTYKATLAGKQVVSVSPFNTSQCDSRTGLKEGKRQGCRFYTEDGLLLDADWNAAVNIAKKSKHPLSNSVLPLHGGLEFLSGRASSTAQSYQGI